MKLRKSFLIMGLILITSTSFSRMRHRHHMEHHHKSVNKVKDKYLDPSLPDDKLRLNYHYLDHYLNKKIRRKRREINDCMEKEEGLNKYIELKKKMRELKRKKHKLKREFMEKYRPHNKFRRGKPYGEKKDINN